jgi:hypothetical protein
MALGAHPAKPSKVMVMGLLEDATGVLEVPQPAMPAVMAIVKPAARVRFRTVRDGPVFISFIG